MRHYITMYGYWYSSSRQNYEAFLRAGADGKFEKDGFNLTEWFKPLKSAPRHYGLYHNPLDWDRKDFLYEIKYLK